MKYEHLVPTQITIFLQPEDEEHALYLINEAFTSTTFRVIDTQEEQVTWGTVFFLMYKEKRLTLELSASIKPGQIHDIADLVILRLVLGFVIRGEIDLEERVVNNLA